MEDGKVRISVTGINDQSGDEPVVNTARGSLYTKSGKRYILYELTDPEDESITRMSLILHRTKLEVSRSSVQARSRIIYDLSRITECEYQTPAGMLLLGFKTEGLDVNEDESLLLIRADYQIYMGNEAISKNTLRIECVPL